MVLFCSTTSVRCWVCLYASWLHEPVRGALLGLVQGTQKLVSCVAPLGNVPVLLAGGKDGTVAVWDVRNNKIALTLACTTTASENENIAMVILNPDSHEFCQQQDLPSKGFVPIGRGMP